MNLPAVLSQLGVNPTITQRPEAAKPDEVAKVAGHVQETRPDIFNQAMRFYSQHPTFIGESAGDDGDCKDCPAVVKQTKGLTGVFGARIRNSGFGIRQ